MCIFFLIKLSFFIALLQKVSKIKFVFDYCFYSFFDYRYNELLLNLKLKF